MGYDARYSMFVTVVAFLTLALIQTHALSQEP